MNGSRISTVASFVVLLRHWIAWLERIPLGLPLLLARIGVAMESSIPDLYLKGQGEYFDKLRVNLGAADVGTKTAQEALDDTAEAWDRITRRMGARSQAVQWAFLKSIYPESIRDRLE